MTRITRPEAAVGTARLLQERDRLLACVHCGFCLNACPTYTRLGDEADSPRGRLYLMRAVMEGRIAADDDAFVTHIDRCLGCRTCEPVCPSGVEYGHLLETARAAMNDTGRSSLLGRTLLAVFGDRLLAGIAGTAGRLFRATGLPSVLARSLPAGWKRVRFAMAMLASSGQARIELNPYITRSGAPAGMTLVAAPPGDVPPGSPRVATLRGCVQEGLFPHVNRATERVLRMNGCTLVEAPAQQCCGALHAHGGDLDEARRLARANIAAFEAAKPDVIAVNAAGCGAMMKQYGKLLERDPAWASRAAALSDTVRDVSEFLARKGVRQGAPLQLRITYDAPCHLLHGQRIDEAPLHVLAAIPGLQHVPLRRADECCGGAGIYGLLHPDLGGSILTDKVAAVQEARADCVVTPNPGCALQIGAGLRMAGDETPVLHPLELLDESYRRMESGGSS
jgi:glycolate oxidase iron-sulfur subunit